MRVIQYENMFYLLRRKTKTFLLVSTVSPKGKVAKTSRKIALPCEYKELKNVTIDIIVKFNYRQQQEYSRKIIINNAKREIFNYFSSKDNSEKMRLVDVIAQMALSSCKFSNGERYYNLSDFCDDTKIKKKEALYKIVFQLFEKTTKARMKEDAYRVASDRTVDKVIDHYRIYWECFVGFYKPLDNLINEDYKNYVNELRRRLAGS